MTDMTYGYKVRWIVNGELLESDFKEREKATDKFNRLKNTPGVTHASVWEQVCIA